MAEMAQFTDFLREKSPACVVCVVRDLNGIVGFSGCGAMLIDADIANVSDSTANTAVPAEFVA